MEQKNAMGETLAKCMRDEEFKARFVSDPKSVLKEYGVEAPEELTIEVIEDTADTVHITLPNAPANLEELSDEKLVGTAAGCGFMTYNVIKSAGIFDCW